MRTTRLVLGYLLLACLLAGCAIVPGRQEDSAAFAEQRINSPVFETADECLDWLEHHQKFARGEGEDFGPRLVLTSWNSQKRSGRRWEEQVHALIEQSDILLLQEAAIIPAQQEVLPYPFVSVAEAFYSWLGPTGLVSASHVEPVASCTFLSREPVIRSKKASNVLLLPLHQRDDMLLVINIHSVNFSMGLGAYSNQIDALAQVMKGHQGPIIFGGDLNTWNQRRIDLLEEVADEQNLREVEFSRDSRARFLGRPLDRIYYRGLHLIDARTSTSTSSDHDPLVVIWDLHPVD